MKLVLMCNEAPVMDSEPVVDPFDAWLNQAYPEPALLCDHPFTQADAFRRLNPLAYRRYRAEWLLQEHAQTDLFPLF